MKYVKQFSIIMLITFMGEILRLLIPLPIPASIYGLVLMLTALSTKIISVDKIKETSTFLVAVMPVMFIPASVGLMESWGELQEFFIPITVIIVVTTIGVMAVTGRITQWVIHREKRKQRG